MAKHAHFIALGHVAYFGANLEKSVNVILCELIDGEPEIGAAVTKRMGVSSQLDLIRSLSTERELPPSLQVSLVHAAKEAQDVMHERNALFHSFWPDIAVDKGTQFRGRERKSLRIHSVRTSEIERIALRMDALIRRLYWYWTDLVLVLGRTLTPPMHPGITFYPDRWSAPDEVESTDEQYDAFLQAVAEGKVSPEPFEPFDDGS